MDHQMFGKRRYENDENLPPISNARIPTYGLNKRAKSALGRQSNFPHSSSNSRAPMSTDSDYMGQPFYPPPNYNYSDQPYSFYPTHDPEFDSPNFYDQGRRKPVIPQQKFPLEEFVFPEDDRLRRFSRPTPVTSAVPAISRPIATASFNKRKEGLRVMTGNVEKALAWSKLTGNQPILLEVIGKIDAVRQGEHPSEKTFRIKDAASGPILEVAFYEIDRPLPDIQPGTMVKVVGSMKTRYRLQAFAVVQSSEDELRLTKHVSYLCDRITHELQ